MARDLCCSFCGRSEREVAKLAAGPPGLFICDGCVEICRLVMAGAEAPSAEFAPECWPTERLLGALQPLNTTLELYRGHLDAVVDALRQRGVSWARIAAPLGVSRQAAWERFG